MPELSMNAAQQAAAADRLRRRLSGRRSASYNRLTLEGERNEENTQIDTTSDARGRCCIDGGWYGKGISNQSTNDRTPSLVQHEKPDCQDQCEARTNSDRYREDCDDRR